jgi:hypothetical protein
MTPEELEKIFYQKKQKIKRTISKKGIVKEKLVDGFELISFKDFQQWFSLSEYEKGCNYCGTSPQDTIKLYSEAPSPPYWTRGGKRGKRLELDRVDPSKKYDELENLVWCCYWCNNSKSNFFNKEEFEPIAVEIGKAIKKRISELK